MKGDSTSSPHFRNWMLLLLAVLCVVGTWTYVGRVLIPHQVTDSALHDTPRGNLSDLYPRWLGARELFLHGRDPYSYEITREIQAGYYGRPLDSSRRGDPIDQQAFAYPVYVVFYLAPTVRLDFGIVQRGFFWILVGVTAASLMCWFHFLRWKVAPLTQAALIALTLGSLPVLQGLKLQQLTLLVAAMCAAGMALLVAGRPLSAGMVLSLATIKPQLALPLLLWLAIWTLADLRRRYRWAVAFMLGTGVLCIASELFLPHWVARFFHAVAAYRQYARPEPILETILSYPAGRIVESLLVAMTVLICFKRAHEPENTRAFQASTCLVLSLTVLIGPNFALYNQALLLPAILLISRERKAIWQGNTVSRFTLLILALVVGWPWFSSVALAGLSLVVRPAFLEHAWAVPIWMLPQIPVAVTGLMLVYYGRDVFTVPAKLGTS
jgi:hypothetical protein